MKKNAPSPDPARRRVLLWWAGLFAAGALLVWGLLPPSAAPFHVKVAGLRAAGYATSPEEHAGEAPPDEENAAVELAEAWDELVALHGRPDSWGVTGPWDPQAVHPWQETATPEQMSALVARLATVAPAVDRIVAATRRPRMWFGVTRDADGLPGVGGVPLLQDVQRVLGAEAAANDDPARRLAAACASLRIGNASTKTGTAIETMVHTAIGAAGALALRDLVERGAVPASDARAAADDLLRGGRAVTMPDTARGEIAFLSDLYAAWLRGEIDAARWTGAGRLAGTSIGSILQSLVGGDRVETPAEVADALERMRAVAEIRPASAEEALRATRSLASEASEDDPFTFWFPMYAERLVRYDAVRALARVALAAAEFREREGRWPPSPEALAPSFPEGVPVDPHDGRPFELTVERGTLRLAPRGGAAGTSDSEEDGPRERGLVWELR